MFLRRRLRRFDLGTRAMAEGLICEFSDLSARTVVREIRAALAVLCSEGNTGPAPAQVEAAARAQLHLYRTGMA
jgi:hypothetical protein